ncbi:30S ribosomal protein S2 [Candidatus Rhabdochlamydia porcellionis]|uniref:30S ribosomal protein S2 n=1 Tax=Candidatus Rhabdochlamydia porcellionis TaxID=225148 RepID=UPI001FE96A67|nr:30S ribosomal protein S2 [Candidatus Rhabdochlamydia porcellionis]
MEQQEQYKEVTIKTLLESGAHFGHQRHRWNPKMKRFIFEERNGIYIIDLSKTLQQIRNATQVVMNTVSKRKSILFVGTKKQAKNLVRECAKQCEEFYVCERWLGGTLTNLTTIRQSIKKLERIEKKIALNADDLTKKELSLLTKDQIKLDRNFSGVRSMRKPPGLLIVVDPSREHIAVAEAKKLGVPVMALVDTNCNPDPIDYIIACNDDALKSIKLILEALTQAILQRKQELKLTTAKEDLEEGISSKEEQEGAK